MIMNSPTLDEILTEKYETLERNRKLSEHCRNVDRLISLNNRRIAIGLRPYAFPTTLIEAGRALVMGGA